MSQNFGWKATLLFGLDCLGNLLTLSEVILLGLLPTAGKRNPWESHAEGGNQVMLCTVLKGYFQLFPCSISKRSMFLVMSAPHGSAE